MLISINRKAFNSTPFYSSICWSYIFLFPFGIRIKSLQFSLWSEFFCIKRMTSLLMIWFYPLSLDCGSTSSSRKGSRDKKSSAKSSGWFHSPSFHFLNKLPNIPVSSHAIVYSTCQQLYKTQIQNHPPPAPRPRFSTLCQSRPVLALHSRPTSSSW